MWIGFMTTESTAATDSRRAINNTVALLASRVATAIMGWAGTVIIARMLSPDEWGQFSLVFGVLGMMSVITDLGVGRVVLSRLTGDDHVEIGRVAASFVSLRLALGVLGYIVAVGFVLVSGYPTEVVVATAIAGLVVVIATPSHALTVLYQSRLKLSYVAAGETIAQLAQLILTVAAALISPVLYLFVIPAVCNELISLLVKIRGIRRGAAGISPARSTELWRWKEMLVEAVPLSIGFAFLGVATRVDVLMLGKLDTFEAVGLYSIGFKFSDFVLVAALAVITPFTTLLVSAWPHRPDEFRTAAHRSALIIGVVCAAGVAGFWPVTGRVLRLLYGDRFVAATLSTQLLLVGGVLGALTQLALMVLVAAGRNRVYPFVALGALALNVCLNFWLIPRHSFTGAAYAVLLSQIAMFVTIVLVIRLTIPIRRMLPIAALAGSALLSAAVITATLWIPGYRDLPWPVVLVANGLLVLAVAHAIGWTGGLSIRNAVAGLRGKTSSGSDRSER